ncbi:MAG TPA: alpha/beta hydrolase [Candidatus Dormibacteraeota bacterium]|nr:alpha/beta hydrolase [Candidatus Dormibacteraeota bacterium]
MQPSRLAVLALAAALVLGSAGCSGSSPGTANASIAGWADEAVTFTAGGITVYGTYRHPDPEGDTVPAALLIAGSGPTDRDGNGPTVPGPVDTLENLADQLASDGVASLRYDKLGSGTTALGTYAAHPETIGIAPFEAEAAAALTFLAGRPGVDRNRLAVIGHSEGALFALLLATGAAGPAPAVHGIGLLEPLSIRYLDVIRAQVASQEDAAIGDGRTTTAAARALESRVDAAISSLRTDGTVPSGLPAGLAQTLSAANTVFLRQADLLDPARLAALLPADFPVLVTCSDADVQVTCAEVANLEAGLRTASTATDAVHLHGVDHVLKQDASLGESSYAADLPFSDELAQALREFVGENL